MSNELIVACLSVFGLIYSIFSVALGGYISAKILENIESLDIKLANILDVFLSVIFILTLLAIYWLPVGSYINQLPELL